MVMDRTWGTPQLLMIFFYSSQNLPFHLQVFLSGDQRASGELFWDDGDSLDTYTLGHYTHLIFNCNSTHLKSEPLENSSLLSINKLNSITIIGLEHIGKVSTVSINGKSIEFDIKDKLLLMEDLSLDFSENILVAWQ